jgi:hypothetical protein
MSTPARRRLMRDFKRWVECFSIPCDRLEALLFHSAAVENPPLKVVLILITTAFISTLEWSIWYIYYMTQKWSGNEFMFNNGGNLVKMEVEGQYIVSTRINKFASCQFIVLLRILFGLRNSWRLLAVVMFTPIQWI